MKRADDPPAWRMAFTLLDAARQDGWAALGRIAVLLALVTACAGALVLCAALLVQHFGYWPLAAGGGVVLAAAGRKRLRAADKRTGPRR
ncbi:hypothetical protein [Saccharothrix yanglingensis]|uniref:hypothetical protein n=1 Tax=Saccharothrix yanglingensis TaxID=659496 RepID=UPI0027D2E083|nr:hypothetical protein [Saccharothrix yanglingensis]